MVATSRFQKALRRAKGTRPYVDKIAELVASVAGSAGPTARHPLLKPRERIQRVGIFVVASNRGLCGGYNGNLLRLAMKSIHEAEHSGASVEIYAAGKKAASYFRFAGRKAVNFSVEDNASYAQVVELTDRLTDDYIAGKIDAIRMVYMHFISVGQQKPVVVDLLPLAALAKLAGSDNVPAAQTPEKVGGMAKARPKTCYEFTPDGDELLIDLIPKALKALVFQAFVEAAVSEQIARMVAMAAATENAESMNKQLTREYNRARQSQITSELSELMGGVEALS